MEKIVLILIFFSLTKSFSQEKDLDFYIKKAQTNSPLLTDIKNQIKSNSLDSLLFRATRKPQISGNLFANYAPLLDSVGYDTTLSNGRTFSALVGLNQRILGRNQIKSQSNTYQLITDALVLNKKIALKDLNRSITSQYIASSGTADQIDYNQKINSLLKNEATLLKKLTQNSVYKQTDYLIFLASIKQQELLVLQLKQQYQNDVGLLNYLVGEVDSTFVKLKKPQINLKSIKKEEKLVFFKTFEIDSLKIQNQNKLIDNAYKPTLSLLSDVGYMSTFFVSPYRNFGLSVGLVASLPIYDGHQRTLQHQKNKTLLQTNLVYKTNFKKQYSQQLLLLNLKLKQHIAIENQLKSQLIIVEALIEADRKLLITGDALITEYVIAIGNLIAIKNAISQNYISKLQMINDINYWSFNDN